MPLQRWLRAPGDGLQARFGGGFVAPSVWIFAFYLYFAARPLLLGMFAGDVACGFTLFYSLVYPFYLWQQGLLFVLAIAALWMDRAMDRGRRCEALPYCVDNPSYFSRARGVLPLVVELHHGI